MEKLGPTHDEESRAKFLEKFNWTDSAFNQQEKQKLQNLLVKHHSIFARHRLDLGKNTDCLIKLTPEHTRPVYTPNTSTPIHLSDELLIELALMQYYEIITTLPFSKYSSPIFAQRKKYSGKLRILIDLRRINHLLRHVYTKNTFPIPTMTDAAHLAGKSIC